MNALRTGFLAGGVALLMAVPMFSAHAGPAANEVWIWPAEAHIEHPDHGEPASEVLNGQLEVNGLSGGVGNTYGSPCCTGGGGAVFRGARRQGADGDIAFRSARDAAFSSIFGGPAMDRTFRFRANRIQRSGF